MTIREIEMKFLNYCSTEYVRAIDAIHKNMAEPWEIVQNACQRMFGVSEFCQNLGVSYEYIEPIYNEYKKRIEEFADGRLT